MSTVEESQEEVYIPSAKEIRQHNEYTAYKEQAFDINRDYSPIEQQNILYLAGSFKN